VVEADPGQIPTALIDGSTCAGAPTARIEGYEADTVHIAVDSPCPGLLVLSDTYYPGWTATVNGKTTPIHPTDIALRGVVVPVGHSEVTMTFAPTTFRHGVIVSILALLVLPVIALGRRLLVRRPAVQTEELAGEERDVDADLDDGTGPRPRHEPGGPAP
jgi:hypothetical protein